MPRAKREKKPKHRTEMRSYVFALDIDASESARLFKVRKVTWELRNLLALERRDNRALCREKPDTKFLTKNDQYKTISALFHTDARFGGVHSQVLQNVADRIDEGTKRWFDAIKEGRHHVAPPRPIDIKRHKSFTYTQYGTAARIKNGKLELSKLGEFKLHDYRKIRGKKKSVTIKFKDGRWWAVITAQIQAADLYNAGPAVTARPDIGVDLGLKEGINDSQGNHYDTPKPLKAAQKQLRLAQKKMSRQFEARKAGHKASMTEVKAAGLVPVPLKEAPRSNRLQRQIKAVARAHTKIARVRDHAHKKNACIINCKFNRVAVEEHGVAFMMANRHTARAAADVGMAKQKHALLSKIGTRYVPTPNRRLQIGGNSQTCLCGAQVPKTLGQRWHDCPECGLKGDRDWISANIAQHIAFGTVDSSVVRACGQQVLERALRLLKTRGDGKALREETRLGRTAMSVESSMKRAPLATKKSGNTAGGKPTAEGKTARHRKGKDLPDVLPGCAATPDVDPNGLFGSPHL